MTIQEITMNGRETYKLLADDGKELIRISDGASFGKETVLGYVWYINGEKLDEKHLETPDEYTEQDCGTTSEEEGSEEYEEPILGKIEEMKIAKIEEISRYDTSLNVNEFFLNGKSMWLDKATRVGIVNAINATIAIGEKEIEIGLGSSSVTLSCSVAKKMMYQLEIYALACYNCTLKHNANVNLLETEEDVAAYDYKVGYPQKIYFTL